MDRKEPENLQNPWKILNEKMVYENEWMGIKEFDVIRPDGKPGIYAYMNCRPAVGIVPVDVNGNTWLVGQFRFPLQQYSWEIPTGMGEADEVLETTAIRELKEETGVIAESIAKLGFFHTSNSLTNEVATLFIGLNCHEEGKPMFDDTEVIEIRKVPFEQALSMCRKGEITDGMSIIGLNRAEHYLNNR